MMLADIQKNFIHKTRIEICDTDYIVVREPTQAEMLGLSDNTTDDMKIFGDILPSCIVEHSFTNADGTPSTSKDVVDALKQSGSLFNEILAAWLNDIPFRSRLQKKAK